MFIKKFQNNAGAPVEIPSNVITSRVVAAVSVAGAVVLDLSQSDYFTLALTENVASIAFSNVPNGAYAAGIGVTLVISQHAGSAKTFALGGAEVWLNPGGIAPTITTVLGGLQLLSFQSSNAGASWLVVDGGEYS